ncbi:MAG TPA: DUF6098 family protein [Actinospica sp.]|jgi:hypothetical protein|nr:DUF6098 family protein [Actinospica sp.]
MLTVRTLDGLAGLLAVGLKVHLRYSAGPEADRGQTSRDYESGLALPGLATLDLDPPPWWTRPTGDWLARQICKYGHLAEHDPERHAWLLTGREVGRGPDNEPLLADPAPLAWLGESVLAEARERYHARFEVGRAS